MKTLATALCVLACVTVGCGKAKTGDSGKTGEGKKTGKGNIRTKNNKRVWKNYEGKNPVLVTVVDNTSSKRYTDFWKTWPMVQAKAQQQNLVVIEIFGLKQAHSTGRIRGGRQLTQVEATDVRDAFGGNPSTFHVTLIGTDGKVIKNFKDPQGSQEVLDLLK